MAKNNWAAGEAYTHTDANTLATEVNGKVTKSGTITEVWGGTQAAYDALPTGTKNAVGFYAVIVP